MIQLVNYLKPFRASNDSNNIALQDESVNEATIETTEGKKNVSILNSLTNSLVNIFNKAIDALKFIFYRLIFCKNPPTEKEKQLMYFQNHLYRVNDLSSELAIHEVRENPRAYTIIGESVYKESYNFVWKLFTSIPFNKKTYTQIGLDYVNQIDKSTNLDEGIKLIPYLKKYYESQIRVYEILLDK